MKIKSLRKVMIPFILRALVLDPGDVQAQKQIGMEKYLDRLC